MNRRALSLRVSCFLALVGASAAYQISSRSARIPNEHFPIYANCETPRRGTLKFTSTARVEKSIFEALSADPSAAASYQLKYLQGYFSHAIPSTIRTFLIGAPRLAKIEKSETEYGATVEFLPMPDPIHFPERYRKPTTIRAGDPAIEVRYSAEQDVLVCGGDPVTSITLPRDPYLAFWYVKPSEWESMKYNQVEKTTNPCASGEIATLPFPSMYWYAWNPVANGCSKLLDENVDLVRVVATFEDSKPSETSRVEFAELAALEKIDVSVVFGLNSQDADRRSLDQAFAEFTSRGDLLASAREFAKEKMSSERFKSKDQAVWAFLYLVDALSNVIRFDPPKIDDQGTHLSLRLTGELAKSRKPVAMKIYFGPTDEPQKKAHHWEFLLEALRSSPVVFYVGHAGMGENFSFETLRRHSRRSEADFASTISSQPYQLLGVSSCYANYYFGDEYLKRRAAAEKSDLLLTAQDGYMFLTPASVLGAVDALSSGENVSLARAIAEGIPPRGAVLYERALRVSN